MIDIEKLKVGDKVYYQPDHYGKSRWENGIIKEIRINDSDHVFVVYNCGDGWENYKNYTSARTNLRDLNLGWRYAIDRERFNDIFNQNRNTNWSGDGVLQGLNIISKCLPNKKVIYGANRDIIYSVTVDELINARITAEDVEKLGDFGWMIEESKGEGNEYLACFV